MASLVAVCAVCAAAAAQPAPVGPSPDGLPGAWRVGSPELGRRPRLSVIGTTGYGWIPGLPGEGGDHHRAGGTLALGALPFEHLALAAGLDGAWDVHPDDELGADASGRGGLFVQVRGAYRWPFGLTLGADARWDLSGANAPDLQPEASRLALRGLASLRIDDVLVLFHAGYRFDGSARAAGPIERYRRGDRVSIDASSFDAVLVGVGVVWTVAPLELFLEGTLEPWVGDGAPALDASPIRAALGARATLVDDLRAHLALELTAHQRLAIAPGSPLVTTEPRVAVLFGLSWSPPIGASEVTAEAETVVEAPEAALDLAPPLTIEGVVQSTDGAPLVSAQIELLRDGTPEPVASQTSDAEGRYRFERVGDGRYRLRIQAEGFEPDERAVVIAGESARPDAVSLVPTRPRGAIRGLVRDFSGRALSARVTIEPGGHEVSTDREGFFELEVPPGEYEIEITAPGLASQRRRARIIENGVFILNADLRRERR